MQHLPLCGILRNLIYIVGICAECLIIAGTFALPDTRSGT